MEEKVLTLRIGDALAKELARLAEQTGRSKSELVREALVALIDVYNVRPKTQSSVV